MPSLIRSLVSLLLLGLPALAQQADPHGGIREELESLLRVSEPTTGFIVFALGVAFLAGAAHALTPGHGKALVGAYLAGSRGTIGDALYLGTVVTITHTGAVFILGIVTLYAAQHFLMEQVYVWLSLTSGLLIVGIGVWLLMTRWQALRSGTAYDHHHHSHGHSHNHVNTHSHTHGHEHDHGQEHVLPRAGRGSLLSLGISGGLVPCPEAMAVLLISITMNRLLFGLVILLAFSLGLAAVLIAIGVAMVVFGPALSRFTKDGPLIRALPVGSAVIVTLVGVVILLKVAGDSGLL